VSERLVVDASVAIKWLVPEEDWFDARRIYENHELSAPDLLCAECANILWKKHRKGEITKDESIAAAEQLLASNVELSSLSKLMLPAVDLSLTLDHPAYDCFYLALALTEERRLVTADRRLLRLVSERGSPHMRRHCVALSDFR
jgi:predicted nucleic acid-binding protein